jgi:hypothetical protein
MRKIFTSPRLENVERVAEMLKEHGVDARITNGRSYKGAVRGHFTYRDHARSEQQPTVWIVKPDDQPKARELMRAAGLLDSGRSPTSYLTTETLIGARDADTENATKQRTLLIKMALLIGIVFAVGIGLLAWRKPAPAVAPAVAVPATEIAGTEPPAPPTLSDTFGTAYRADVPSALAAMLLLAELSAHEATEVCLSVDGAAAPERILAQLQASERALIRSQAACAAAKDANDVVSVAVREYHTDGSGTGTVQVEIADQDKNGKPRVDTRTLEVKRDGLQWEVKRVVLPQ